MSMEDIWEIGMKLEVVCRAGYKGEERPVRFRLGETNYFVEEVLDQWYGPDDQYFKVSASGEEGGVYILRRSLALPGGGWRLESYRR